jgi:hypothetical protein
MAFPLLSSLVAKLLLSIGNVTDRPAFVVSGSWVCDGESFLG